MRNWLRNAWMSSEPCRFVLAMCASVTLAGCVLPLAPDEETPFNSEDLAFIVPNKTTREEISVYFNGLERPVKRLSEPDDQMDIYYAQYKAGGFSVDDFFDLAYYPTLHDYFAVFHYDTDGRVVDFAISNSNADDLKDCQTTGLCMRKYHLVMRADYADDRRAKKFETSSNTCSLYVYANTGFAEYIKLFRLDEGRKEYLHKDDYLLISTEAGKHTAWTNKSNRESLTWHFEFECLAGEVVFLDASNTGATLFKMEKPSLTIVSKTVGQQQIRQRHLALATYLYRLKI